MIEQAILLAAGSGRRISSLLGPRPKGFIEIGGEAIAERSLKALLRKGVREVIVVTGFGAEYYERLVRRHPAASTVFNSRFAETGSMGSLALAVPRCRREALVLEADLLYQESALDALAATKARDAVLLSGLTRSGDEVYADGSGGRLARLSKDRASIRNLAGEFTGLSKLSKELLEKMALGSAQDEYDSHALSRACADSPVAYVTLEDLVWCEIDCAEHLERAVRDVYPRLSGPAGGRRP
jgi:2-aminoethylphosphonate-pyruvate transaminase